MAKRQVIASYSNVTQLAAELGFSQEAHARALQLADLTPSRRDWHRYIDHFMTAIGAVLVVAGIAAFFASNWADLSYVVKFALIQIGIVGSAVLAWKLGLDSIGGKSSLFAAAFLIGILMAVFGQVYQTGADPYGLFLAWAIFVLPLAIVGRQAGLWILFQTLLAIALIMYWTQVVDPPDGWWQLATLLGPLFWLASTLLNSDLAGLVFALNVVSLIIWETAANKEIAWLQGRTFPRLVAFGTLTTVLVPTTIIIMAGANGWGGEIGVISPILYLAATMCGLYYYQHKRRDLLILSLCSFGAVQVLTTVLVRFMIETSAGILFLAIMLIAQVAGAAYWLRTVSRKWEGAS